MQIHFKNYSIDISINRIIRYFILADLTFLAGWGLVDPILAIFVINKIEGATLVTVGVMAGIYWITKSVIQLPIGIYLDKTKGEKDDFYALVIGLLVASLSLFSFMAATEVIHLYFIQFIKAIGFALYIPAWLAIVSRHLDKERVAFEWALNSTSIGIAMGIAGLASGWLAGISFNMVFLLAGFLALASALILLLVPNLILPPKTSPNVGKSIIKDHRPVNIQK